MTRTIRLTDPKRDTRVDLILRPLRSDDDYAACVALERKTWGDDFAELVPPSILMISQKVGGISAGAFTPDGEIMAMIYGLTGIREGRPCHWSHMLAVDERARGWGLGRQMKCYQRDCLIQIGVAEMAWTYDPLQAVNAKLNMKRLGAQPVDYALDVYGSGDTSGLHRGIGTDRFIVRWVFDTPHDDAAATRRFGVDVPTINTDVAGMPLEGAFPLPEVPRLKVEVPADIGRAKESAPGMGRRWRLCTRRAFQFYMTRGWSVTCFLDEGDGRCYYGLERGGTP